MKKQTSLELLAKIYSYDLTATSTPLAICLAVIVIALGMVTLWVPILVLIAWAGLLLAEAIVGFSHGVALGTKFSIRKRYGTLPKEHVMYKKIHFYVFRSSQAVIMNAIKILSAAVLIGASIAAIFTI